SGHKLTLSFLAVALGATLISLILQLDRTILKEFALSDQKPALFIFDIQEEQIDELMTLAEEGGTPLAGVTPLIRARLGKVNGKKFVRKKPSFELRPWEDDDPRMRSTGMNLSYRGQVSASERIIDVEPFPASYSEDR